jgi:type IV pilus assembly protein PilN
MIKINLLKEEIAPTKKRKVAVPKSEQQRSLLFLLIFIIAVGVIGYMFWSVNSKLNDLNRNIKMAQEEKQRLEGIIAEVNKYQADKDLLERKLNLIIELDKNRSSPVELMIQLQELKPNHLWFNKITERGDQITIEGMAISYNSIAEFDGNLTRSKYFTESNVELLDAEELPGGEKRFALTCRFVKATPPSEEKQE